MANKENNIKNIVESKLCNSCGACIASCPFNIIKKDNDNIPRVSEENCINCGICKQVCQGTGVDFLRYYEKFHKKPYNMETTLGDYQGAYLSFANNDNVRQKGTSGGFIKAFLVSLLETSKIQGVILISSDEKECFKAKAIVARSKEDILNTGKSKYSRSLTLDVLKEIENESGKFAIVGLPCQIQALWKIRKLNPKINNRILVTIGLFCHAQVEVVAKRIIFKKFGLDKLNIKEYISRYGKHPGTPHVRLENDDIIPVYFPKKKFFRPTSHEVLNVMYHLYTPKRCMYCFDGASELADISIGDPWFKKRDLKNFKDIKNINFNDGYSFVLVRSDIGNELINFAFENNAISIKELPKEIADKCNKKMLKSKKLRAWYFIKKEGKVDFGDYEKLIPNLSQEKLLKQRISNIFHILCFYPSIRNFILKILLSNFGYIFLYINNLKRKFKK